MDLDPSIFDGNFINVKIFVTITEGVGQPTGGLLECRGADNLAEVNSCDPNNEFFCQASTIPDCNLRTWTLERLELIPGAKLNLTNRFPFQPPYNPGNYDVVYVKELILREGSVLNTSYNKIYYGSLTKEPNAVIMNMPLLGFSLINISMDDPNEFIVRVTPNNYTDLNEPNYSRTHVERVVGLSRDLNGMMLMRNLEDLDPNSATYSQTIAARAKGLFAKSSENEILILFEYLFGAVDPNTKLVIYLSDIPELGDVNDTNDYYKVAELLPPLPGQPGSVGSGKLGVFKQFVPKNGLNFVRGTRIEFMLLGGNGIYMFIKNWDPGNCACGSAGICLNLTCSDEVSTEDFVNLLSNYGTDTDCSGMFGCSGTIGSTEMCGWDWASSSESGNCCGPLPLADCDCAATGSSSSVAGDNFGNGYQLGGVSDGILVCGKSGTPTNVLKDGLYTFDNNGRYLNMSTPTPDNRGNMRLVTDFDGNVYRLNSTTGILSLDGSKTIVGIDHLSSIKEPRYKTLATVNVGIDSNNAVYYGRPILDAAFDPDFIHNNYVYIVPVVVEPAGGQTAYTAAAKLQLSGSSYSVVKLYDDPDANKPGDNRDVNDLREVEVDTAGNLYVLNTHYNYNKSDILWKYNASSGAMIERLVLGDPNSEANYVPAPCAMYLSAAQDMLYLASSLSPVEANSSKIYGFSTSGPTLTLARTVNINGMGHVTGITDDPTTGILWVAGFSMKLPVGKSPAAFLYNSSLRPFYEPNLAEVPIDSNDVNAICTLSANDPNNDLYLPLSIVWTVANKYGGADLDSSGCVDTKDLGLFVQQWLREDCKPPSWCNGADLNPYIGDRGKVDFIDFAIFARKWLAGCQ
jgi:hypothetical protein